MHRGQGVAHDEESQQQARRSKDWKRTLRLHSRLCLFVCMCFRSRDLVGCAEGHGVHLVIFNCLLVCLRYLETLYIVNVHRTLGLTHGVVRKVCNTDAATSAVVVLPATDCKRVQKWLRCCGSTTTN